MGTGCLMLIRSRIGSDDGGKLLPKLLEILSNVTYKDNCNTTNTFKEL